MKIVSSKALDFNWKIIIIIIIITALRQSLCKTMHFLGITMQTKELKKITIPFLNLMVLFAPSLLFNDSFPTKSAEKRKNNNADMG